MVDWTFTESAVPAGRYIAKFLKAEPFEEHVGRFGPATAFRFEIVTGPYKGENVARVAANKAKRGSPLEQMVSGLLGRQIEAGKAL